MTTLTSPPARLRNRRSDAKLLKALIRQMARNMRRFDGSTPEKQRLAVLWLQNDLAVLADIVARSITPLTKKKGKANDGNR